MIVFLGWSHSGKQYAEALKQFLLACFETGVTVRVSMGLPKGRDWSDALLQELKGANFGIMCLTPDSDSAWMCYEAGVLDSVGAPVVPLLFSGVSKAFAPMTRKQATTFTKEDVEELMKAIYIKSDLKDWDTYNASFEKAWPEFWKAVQKLEAASVYRMKDFEADLNTLLDPKHSYELGVWAAKRGEALAAILNDNALPLLLKAQELQAYREELRKYESKNPLFTRLHLNLERLIP